jgi:hypothetical protein
MGVKLQKDTERHDRLKFYYDAAKRESISGFPVDDQIWMYERLTGITNAIMHNELAVSLPVMAELRRFLYIQNDLPKLASVTQTCEGCPSQWEGRLEDGRCFYIRYRWGHLQVWISKNASYAVKDALDGEQIYSEQHGPDMDGVMQWPSVENYLSNVFDFSLLTKGGA